MGDSDDEYDKKRRDKFQGERTESYRNERRKDEDWGRARVRNDYRDRYQYQEMPPAKRMRFEPNEDMRRMRYEPYNSFNPWVPDNVAFPPGNSRGDVDTQPPMMTFKSFLQTQDDNITDEEAISKYAEYKMEFRRQQLNEFFVAHKEEEWFKLKYHPEESQKRKQEQIVALKKRASVFLEMLNRKRIDSIRVDADQGDAVVKLLDSVVIRLEGGTDLDLQVLEASPESQEKEDKDKDKENPSKAEDKDKETPKEDDKEEKMDVEEKIPEDKTEDKIEAEEPTSKEEEEDDKPEEVPKDNDDDSEKKETKDDESDKEQNDEVVPLTPRPLHKTSSIFLRTISPRITKAEIETICKKYNGFLRVSLSDPQPEQHWFRRGWVTFRRDVNIKEICWNINNIRVKDCEMGAIVNRDLSRRVRSVSGLSAHKQVVLSDIKLCARIIQELDARYSLWDTENDTFISSNPVLRDITEFLVEEAPAEEEALLGENVVDAESKNRHSAALKALDKLLLYLRIVFSVDYYNMSQYASEDEMPNRCGIMHLRGMPSNTEVSQNEITEYCENYKNKLEPLLHPPEKVPESDLAQLGAKSEEAEVEKFIQANTQELAKDKWLCPLSGKKFKGATFVRKHIFNKYADQLDEVKKEVDYFNNYLRDPKRPQLAEHPGNRSGKKDVAPPSDPAFHNYQYPPPFKTRGFGHFGHPFPRGRGGFPRGGRSMDYRPIITYRDLDAPSEPDEII